MNKLVFLVLSVLCFSCGNDSITDLSNESSPTPKYTGEELSTAESLKRFFNEKEFYIEEFTCSSIDSKLTGEDLCKMAIDSVNKKLNFEWTKNIFTHKYSFNKGSSEYVDIYLNYTETTCISFMDGGRMFTLTNGTKYYDVKRLNKSVVLLMNCNDNCGRYKDCKLLIDKNYIKEFRSSLKPTKKVFDKKSVSFKIDVISTDETTIDIKTTIINGSVCDMKIKGFFLINKNIDMKDYILHSNESVSKIIKLKKSDLKDDIHLIMYLIANDKYLEIFHTFTNKLKDDFSNKHYTD